MDEDYSSDFTYTNSPEVEFSHEEENIRFHKSQSPELSLSSLVKHNLQITPELVSCQNPSPINSSSCKLLMVRKDIQLGFTDDVIVLNSPIPLTVTLPPLQLGAPCSSLTIKSLGNSYIDHEIISSKGDNINFNVHGYFLRSPKSVTFWSYENTWISSD